MPSWNDGYVSDITYTSNIYREQLPSWIGFATLLMGHGAPDIAQPFRVAELGCGYGMSLAAAAACSPQAEFWGFDFNPAHIEAARELATEAGLTNLHYEERAFDELLSLDLPDFDLVLMHGVWSWVGANARRAAMDFIKAKLRPGGLVYNSYNVMTGWSAMLPVRALMRLAGQGHRSDQVFPIVRALIEQLRQNGAGYFIVNERALEPRLKMLDMFDARYLAHEFLNEAWEPMMFADVAAEMAEAKCGFVASAILSDNMNNASVPGTMAQLLQNTPDVTMRETCAIWATRRSFAATSIAAAASA
jgi:SAM-dependent methyltransferase